MKSYVVREFGAPLAALETPTPLPQGTEVLIEVQHCGVCHTDVHLREGSFDLGGGKRLASKLVLPHVLGHEIEGRVAAAGPAAGAVTIGARYAVFPWIGCGRCSACRRGEENVCLGETRQLGCSSACPAATPPTSWRPTRAISSTTARPIRRWRRRACARVSRRSRR